MKAAFYTSAYLFGIGLMAYLFKDIHILLLQILYLSVMLCYAVVGFIQVHKVWLENEK